MNDEDITFRNGRATFDQLRVLSVLQAQVFKYGVPYHLLKNFYNEFQLSAVIAKVGHDIAVSLDSIEKISDYFTKYPELINNALVGLVPVVTMNELMKAQGSNVFNYVSAVTIMVHDLIIEMAKAIHENKEDVTGKLISNCDADTSFESAFSDFSSEDVFQEGIGFFGSFFWNECNGSN